MSRDTGYEEPQGTESVDNSAKEGLAEDASLPFQGWMKRMMADCCGPKTKEMRTACCGEADEGKPPHSGKEGADA